MRMALSQYSPAIDGASASTEATTMIRLAGPGRQPGKAAVRPGSGSARSEAFDMLDPFDCFLAEQPGRPDQEEDQRDGIGEPVGDAPAEKRADIDFGEALGGTDDEATDDGAADRGEAADDQDRQRLEHHQGQG